jgi:predicted ferric reductase
MCMTVEIASRSRSTGLAARGRSTRRGDAAIGVAGLGLGASIAIGIHSVQSGLDLPGGMLLAAGTVAALAGTYLCLMLLMLISRLPWLEREMGHDRMVSLHRTVAPYSLVLIAAHVVLTTLSYASAAQTGIVAELWQIVFHSAWMIPATIGFVGMIALGVMSARAIRSRMKYETWWLTHLLFYVAVALSFGHQIALGPMFAGAEHTNARYFWSGLYILVAATIVLVRIVLPLATSLKHQLKVEDVVVETDGVVSVYVSGVDLDLLKARGGQFFQWRFLTREWWWQAHPYSLSAAPNAAWLRITVKDLGDQSARLAELRPGTRVMVEGPYGVFTAAHRHGERVTALAAGVGITPIRALLEDLPHDSDVTVVYRVADETDAPLRAEIESLVFGRGWTLYYLTGPRSQYPINAANLVALAPHFAESDVYVCGPDAFTRDVCEAAREAGVADERIHHEAFSF